MSEIVWEIRLKPEHIKACGSIQFGADGLELMCVSGWWLDGDSKAVVIKRITPPERDR